MEGNPNESIKTEPNSHQVMSPMGVTEEPRESVVVNAAEYQLLMNFLEAQRQRATGIDPSQVALPLSPSYRSTTLAPAQVPAPQPVVNQPTAPGYRTVTIPEGLACSIFGQISNREMEERWRQEQDEAARAANRAGLTPDLKIMFDNNQPVLGIPTIKH